MSLRILLQLSHTRLLQHAGAHAVRRAYAVKPKRSALSTGVAVATYADLKRHFLIRSWLGGYMTVVQHIFVVPLSNYCASV